MEKQRTSPPRAATKFLRFFIREKFHEEIVGDLKENFDEDLRTGSRFRAQLNYWKQIVLYMRPFAMRSPRFVNPLINSIMLRSYFKTSVRNVKRNKLFSFINIAGLAVSMSVGLLLMAFVHDLLSYDKFNQKGDRIYRITSQASFRIGHEETFASTSIRAGKLIQENVSGVEESVILQNEFSGDAILGDKRVPVTGMYAEPSMLKIFTLPMLKGNVNTALNDPYSIVLTETSAKKLFGQEEAFGKFIRFDSMDYRVTGILKDIPFFSHIRFESLVSFSTLEARMATEPSFLTWSHVFKNNYVYIRLANNTKASDIQLQLDAICADENRYDHKARVTLTLLPLYDIMLGDELSNSIRPVVPKIVLWIIGGLALIVVLSACFNYTNLSIARSMRRFREVGLRKAIGAGKIHVRGQFLTEAVIVSLVALGLAVGIFLILRPEFISIAPDLLKMVKLEITVPMAISFFAFAVIVGIMAGILPAVFFSKVSAIRAMKDTPSVEAFKGLGFRRVLVVGQYTTTLIFITSTIIGYVQYKDILAFDLGFNTENILNISLQKNKPDILINKLKTIPEVSGVSQSRLLTSVGNVWGGFMKYKNVRDSALVLTNIVDENYIPLHKYKLIAGSNFIARPATRDATSEVIVNEETLRRFDIAGHDPESAIGEEVLLDNRSLTIVGVISDFHYGKLDENIQPVVFTFLTPDAFLTADRRDGLVNVRVNTNDPVATMDKIRAVWTSIDPVHPLEAQFYDDAIEEAYHELSAMIKVVGFLSFIAITIASLGLLGMVVFTTETRLREISIRKVFGATTGNLVFLLACKFFVLLALSGLIAIPVTYVFFERVVLTKFPFHEPVGPLELFAGLMAVVAVALVLIGTQTLKAVERNPADVLKNE